MIGLCMNKARKVRIGIDFITICPDYESDVLAAWFRIIATRHCEALAVWNLRKWAMHCAA